MSKSTSRRKEASLWFQCSTKLQANTVENGLPKPHDGVPRKNWRGRGGREGSSDEQNRKITETDLLELTEQIENQFRSQLKLTGWQSNHVNYWSKACASRQERYFFKTFTNPFLFSDALNKINQISGVCLPVWSLWLSSFFAKEHTQTQPACAIQIARRFQRNVSLKDKARRKGKTVTSIRHTWV